MLLEDVEDIWIQVYDHSNFIVCKFYWYSVKNCTGELNLKLPLYWMTNILVLPLLAKFIHRRHVIKNHVLKTHNHLRPIYSPSSFNYKSFMFKTNLCTLIPTTIFKPTIFPINMDFREGFKDFKRINQYDSLFLGENKDLF